MLIPTLIGIQLLLIGAQAQDCFAPPPRARPNECCSSMPKFIPRETAQECGMPAFMSESGGGGGGPPPPPPHGGPKGISCDAVLCVMKKQNLITDNNVNRPAFKTFMETQYSSEWKSAIASATETCNSEVDAGDPDCEPKKYMKCFKRNTFLNCPSQFWSQTENCQNMKTFMQNCPMAGPPMG